MAEAGVSLNDFFAKKKKPKFKGINLNSGPASDKAADKNAKPKDDNEEGWQEEQVVASTIGKVEVAGNLNRTEDKKEEEDNSAPAWGTTRKVQERLDERDKKRFPSLKATGTNINIDDGTDAQVNIKTSKNKFQALGNEEDDSDAEIKRPKEIKPAMVQKKKGEFTKAAIKREVDKYTDKKGSKKKKKKDSDDEDEEEVEDESEEESEDEDEKKAAAADAAAAKAEAKKKAAQEKKKAEQTKQVEEAAEADEEEDVKIEADPAASKAKYENRKKPFPAKSLPRFDIEEEKIVKPKPGAAAGGKKGRKKAFMDEEEDSKSKLQYVEG